MYKISITGKANTGKNTVSKLIVKELRNKFKGQKTISYEYVAFADPIKAMIRLMFPTLPEKYLTGSSQNRTEAIPGAFKDGKPLTVRQLLIDLGTGFGRACKETIWLDAFDHTFEKLQNKSVVIVTDVRFRNEFDHLRDKGFYKIRLLRDAEVQTSQSNHISETNQDGISNDEFDFVINNNGTLKDLKKAVSKIVEQLQP
jgi:Cdc6-like AAA superfamily ATPase